MGLGIPPLEIKKLLEIKELLESKPPKSRFLVREVTASPGLRPGVEVGHLAADAGHPASARARAAHGCRRLIRRALTESGGFCPLKIRSLPSQTRKDAGCECETRTYSVSQLAGASRQGVLMPVCCVYVSKHTFMRTKDDCGFLFQR